MAFNNRLKLTRLDLLKLLPVLVLAFYIAFVPHQNYPYPVHIDEWIHITHAKAILQAGSTTYIAPFLGQETVDTSLNLEAGYHLFLGILRQVTGIQWFNIVRYFPGIIFVITVLSVYALTRRDGFGLEAAFFTCLIPTSVGILGPAFLVPMATGLLFIPLSLFLAFHIKTWPAYLLLFVYTCFLLSMHAPTAIGLCVILMPYILFNVKGNFRHSLGITLALAIPFLAPFPWIFQNLLSTAKLLVSPQLPSSYVVIPPIIQDFGYFPIILGFLGIIFLVMRGGKKHFGIISGFFALLLMLAVFYTLHYGLPVLYERGLTYMILMLSIITGAGLFWVRTIGLPRKHTGNHGPFLSRNLGNILCLILIVIILAISIPNRLNASYYHMIDKEDYRAFTWIGEHLNEDYQLAILDPWKATAFTAITQKYVYRRIFIYIEPIDRMVYLFLNEGCRDTSFLKYSGISVLYNQGHCNNTSLIEVRKHVYLTAPNFSNGISEPAGLKNPGFWDIWNGRPLRWGKWAKNCTPKFLYPEPGRNGDYCAGIEMSETEPFDPWPSSLWAQSISVEAGKSYRVGGWIRTEDVAGRGGAMIIPHWKGPEDEWISQTKFMRYVQGTSGWTYYEGVVTAPQGATTCTVCCLLAGSSGKAWFDDIFFGEQWMLNHDVT